MDICALEFSISQQMERHRVAGLGIAVVEGGELSYAQVFGCRSVDASAPLTPTSLFLAGSLSKPVFAYGVLLLCQRGLLDLDTPLAELWPEPFSPDPRLAQVTARHVLSHSAGFPPWREDGAELPMLSAPGQQFEYSGEGYEYLQKVIEHLTGAPLSRCWRELVLAPLGMADSQFRWDAYDPPRTDADQASAPIPERRHTADSAAHTLMTSAADFGRFLCALLSPASHELRAATFTPQIAVDEALGLRWGLGWGLQSIGGERSGWHWGKVGAGDHENSSCSYVAVLPARRRGVAIFTNTLTGLEACEAIAQQALDMPEPHPAFRWLGL